MTFNILNMDLQYVHCTTSELNYLYCTISTVEDTTLGQYFTHVQIRYSSIAMGDTVGLPSVG